MNIVIMPGAAGLLVDGKPFRYIGKYDVSVLGLEPKRFVCHSDTENVEIVFVMGEIHLHQRKTSFK
jgi:hypothetical protein